MFEEDRLEPTALPLVAACGGRRWVMTRRAFGLGPWHTVMSDIPRQPRPLFTPLCRLPLHQQSALSAARGSSSIWCAPEVFSRRAKPKIRPVVSPLKQFPNPFYCQRHNGIVPTDAERRLNKLLGISEVNIADWPAGENYNNKIRSSGVRCQRSREEVSRAQRIDGAERPHGAAPTGRGRYWSSSILVSDERQIKDL